MTALMHDLRFALRQIRRRPGFFLAAVITLALGIGANTAIYSLLDQALVRSLPVRSPKELVVLSGTGEAWDGHTSNHGAGVDKSFSYPMYRDLRDRGAALSGLIATSPVSVGITRNQVSALVDGEIVSGNYFTMLGVSAARGRLLTPADDTVPGSNPVAVLSYAYWQKLGGDPGVVGASLLINGHPYEVVGVAAPGFQSVVWGETPNVFLPMSMLDQVLPGKGKRLTDRTDRWMNIIGRLKPGEPLAQAQAGLAPLWHALRAEELKALGTKSPRFVDQYLTHSQLLVLPGARGLSYNRSDLETPLTAVMAMAALVLLIAAVNVASLLLVRSAARVREFAMRYALGAGTGRVLQQLLLEGLLIGLTGGVAGLLLAPAALHLIVRQLAPEGNTAFQTALDARLLLFNFAAALLVSVGFSLAPAIALLRPQLGASLKQQAATPSGGALSFRRVIVSLQVGLSVLLLVGSGLFVRTMQNLRRVDTGFNTSHLVTFTINPQLAGYPEGRVPELYRRVLDTAAALPGVQSVGATTDPELANTGTGGNVTVEGYTPPPEEDFDVERPTVSPDFFRAMQVRLLAGRTFSETDDATHPLVGVVNETFVRHFFSSPAAALGRRVARGGGKNLKYMTIIGVTADTKHENLRDAAVPTLYAPMLQETSAGQLALYLRTATPPEQMFATVRQAMQQIDPTLAIDGLRTMDDQVDATLTDERMIELLAISFGLLATLLAGVGLYGVLAYSTAQRTREIGIRIALGSTRLAICRIVLVDVLRLTAIGVAVALPCSVLLARLLRSQLFGVSAADPITLLGVVVLMGAVALAAALLPARRATSVNPTVALRAE